MIVQREENVDGTQTPHFPPDTQTLAVSSTTEETFPESLGWAQGFAERPQHHKSFGSNPIELCCQISPVSESPESATFSEQS